MESHYRKSILSWFGLFVLTLLPPSTVEAECAWVFWIKREINFIYPNKPPTFSTEWHVRKVVLSLSECEQMKKRVFEVSVKQIKPAESPGIEKVEKSSAEARPATHPSLSILDNVRVTADESVAGVRRLSPTGRTALCLSAFSVFSPKG